MEVWNNMLCFNEVRGIDVDVWFKILVFLIF